MNNTNIINMAPSLTYSECVRLITASGADQTILITSEPGVGKSSMLDVIVERLGTDRYRAVYVDCGDLDFGDLVMKVPSHAEKRVLQYVSDLIFPEDDNRIPVILFDEMAKLPEVTRTTVTTCWLERRVGVYKLPLGNVVFGATNNVSDGLGDIIRGHEGNRITIVPMDKPTVKEWLPWAAKNGISAVTCAFAAMNEAIFGSYLDAKHERNPHIFHPKKNAVTFLSPRSLAKADIAYVQKREVLGEKVTFSALTGTIGRAGAELLSSFIALEKELLPVRSVFKDPSLPVPQNIAALYLMMFNAVDAVETQDDLGSFMQFMDKANSRELEAVFFTMLVNNSKTLKLARGNKRISEWLLANHKVLN